MLKRVKTKNSAPGRSSVKTSKIQKEDVTKITEGSDQDSTENSKAFDNPQEERGYDSTGAAKIPDQPLPASSNGGRSGTTYDSPNFQLNTGAMKEQPKQQLGMKSISLDDKANRPLQKVSTNDGNITSLQTVQMSKPVTEIVPGANDIARKNATYPGDFKNEASPMQKDFNADSFAQMEPTKSSVFQSVVDVPFESVQPPMKELRQGSKEDTKSLMNPTNQPGDFTDYANKSIPSDFLTTSDLSSSNVYSTYSSNTKEYGAGKFPESTQASGKMSEKTKEGANASSPQRAADSINSTKGKGSMKAAEIPRPEAKLNMAPRDSALAAASSVTSQPVDGSSKSFFTSNFSFVPGSIGSGMDESSSSTNNVASTLSSS